jgi:hypothetical protein
LKKITEITVKDQGQQVEANNWNYTLKYQGQQFEANN